MGYANILVALDLGADAPDRVGLAAGLARRFAATLTGAAAQSVRVPVLVGDLCDAADDVEDDAARIRGILQQARAAFERSAGSEIRTAWQAAFADPVTHLVAQACAADLVVVSRHGPDDPDPGPLGTPPGPVLMEAGRPVLIVPPRTVQLKAARILTAWKDGLEARRAVSAALPFFRSADQVFVATLGEDVRPGNAEDLAVHLARHGANATARHLPAAGRAGDAILRFALDQDADLIVMGAYGHPRLREWVFGGLTRDVLDRTPICCLMCH
jgi:nucleotide-binding universal stress UspA family protein